MSAISASTDIVFCRVCAYVIPAAARKCTKCGSWQRGLSAFLPFTESSLSVLLALISVATIVGPPFVKWLGKESLTRVAIITAEQNRDLQISVVNSGAKPTMVRSYRVDFVGAESFLPWRTVVPRNNQNAAIAPDKDATIQLHGALKIPLADDEAQRKQLADWIEKGTVQLTACVKQSGSGVAQANLFARAGTCEAGGWVTATDSIAASELKEWIEGLVQWQPKQPQSASPLS